MQPNHWLPLTEYALRSGTSISTLRRKIKANAIDYKMEEGRYLIRFEDGDDSVTPNVAFHSTDSANDDELDEDFEDEIVSPSSYRGQHGPATGPQAAAPMHNVFEVPSEILLLRREMQDIRDELSASSDEGSMRWRALETRVSGIAKKLELFTEQFAELKMLVKLFEEKLDRRG